MGNRIDPATILVIDDEAFIRQSFADYLEDRDYAVLTAENGRTGLELMAQRSPSLVLVDLRMPEMDGLEVLRRGGKLHPDMPKIVVSGANRVDEVVEALRLGAWDYLIKPVRDLSMLGHSVSQALEKSRLIQENRVYQEHLERMVRLRTEELEKSNSQLSNINSRLKRMVKTTSKLSVCSEVRLFGSHLLEEFGAQMMAGGGSLYLVEKNGLQLVHCLDPGHAPAFIPFPLKKNTVFEQAISEKQPVLIKDVRTFGKTTTSGWEGYNDGSALIFPLQDDNGVITGILSLHSKNEPPFIEQDREIGIILSSYACETLRAVKASEMLQASEKKYRTLFEKTNDAIFLIDRLTGRHLDANSAAEKLTGRTHDKLIQSTTEDIIAKEDLVQLLTSDIKDTPLEMGKITFIRPDESMRTADVHLVPLNDREFFGIARDVTQMLSTEEQLHQAQKMEALGRLAGGVAHDLNNLLVPILGYSEILSDKFSTDDTRLAFIQQIHEAGGRAKDLVRQLLAFGRKQALEMKIIDLNSILNRFEKLLRRTVREDIQMRMLLSRSDCKIRADIGQIEQVIMNLVVNAQDAMPNGGRLTIKTGISRNHDVMQKKFAIMTITDNGHGMDAQTRERIFDPFFTTKSKGKGTGLGLATVYGIVKQHEGYICVFSEPNEGATFQVCLPIVDETQDVITENRAISSVLTGSETIMVVEDNRMVRDLAENILTKFGYRVFTASSGRKCLEILHENDVLDLLITDVIIPDMNGKILADRISQIFPEAGVLYMSGYTDDVIAHHGVLDPDVHFIQKPFSIEAFAGKVRQVLQQKNG